MLVFFALGNAKVLSFELGDAKVPNANCFAVQWNIGLSALRSTWDLPGQYSRPAFFAPCLFDLPSKPSVCEEVPRRTCLTPHMTLLRF